MNSNPAVVTRLGLIGAGRWGRNLIRTIRSLPSATLAGLYSRNPESHSLLGPETALTEDWRALLDRHRYDGVIMATPPETHAALVEAAIRASMPCMVEKPLTTNLDEALLLQRLCCQYNALVLVNHTQLFHPAYALLKQSANKVFHVESDGGNWGPFRPSYTPLWDYAPHDFALCLDLLRASPVKIALTEAQTSTQESGWAGTYRLDLEFPCSVNATILVSNLRREKIRRLLVSTQAGP